MMKKKYLTLEIGECWIRKGSKQSRATREDYDRLYLLREKYISNHSVRFGFGNDFSNEILYNIPKVDIENSPSFVKKLKLEALIVKLRAFIEDEEKSIKKPQINRFGLPQMAGIFSASYGDYDPSKKAIMSGYNDLGLPFFCTEDDLIKRIDNCTETYYEDDLHYYLEVNSQKQNFFMLNESNMFLEDAEVKLRFPKSAFVVADRVYKEPVHLSIFEKLNRQPDFENTRYPLVSENEDSFLVEQSHATIRHKEITSLFEIDLRIYVKSDAEGVYPISYQISAKNLPNPIKGELKIIVERPGKK